MADEPIAQEAPVEQVPETGIVDPFALDEAKFAILSPEQRATVEPILNEWKTKAKSEIEKSSKTYEEKYKPHIQKAEALEELARDPRFVQWWQGIQQQAANINPSASQSIGNANPQDFATPEQWQQAILNASNGDGSMLRQIQQTMIQRMASPVIEKIQAGQEELKTMFEMKDLFERYPDAKVLDSIGRNPSDPNDKSMSHLEMWLNWASENGKSLDEGYQMAKKIWDQSRVGAQQEAMGMVQEKKASVTSGPSTAKGGPAVVEVNDLDELMSKQMEYQLAGQKPPRFVIREASAGSKTQWAQRA